MTETIAFVGAGNMAGSLIGGLIADGFPIDSLWAADPVTEQREQLHKQFAVNISDSNDEVVAQADIVVLAVKPQRMRSVASALAATVQTRKPLLISIAAGITTPDLCNWLGGNVALVRCMPNTPALLQSGATGLYANPQVSAAQQQAAERILRAVGITVWVNDETLLDSVTALSGSGPAYFFLVMEALEQAGIELGLAPQTARELALHTALGAAKMALNSAESPVQLRARVTSPGGTTERAIGILQDGGLEALFATALRGAHERCRELSELLGGSE